MYSKILLTSLFLFIVLTYSTNASLLNVITVNRITYEKFKEKDENGYYGKYHFKQHNTIPYSEALMKNKGKAPKLNSAPIKKK